MPISVTSCRVRINCSSQYFAKRRARAEVYLQHLNLKILASQVEVLGNDNIDHIWFVSYHTRNGGLAAVPMTAKVGRKIAGLRWSVNIQKSDSNMSQNPYSLGPYPRV